MKLLAEIVAVPYLLIGFRYAFAHIYPNIIRQELKKTEKVYNNEIGRWEEPKIRTSSEGTWNDVTRAAGWSLIWMWVWPVAATAFASQRAGKAITRHDAHKLATALTMTKRSPELKRLDSELRELTIKQLEKETGIGDSNPRMPEGSERPRMPEGSSNPRKAAWANEAELDVKIAKLAAEFKQERRELSSDHLVTLSTGEVWQHDPQTGKWARCK